MTTDNLVEEYKASHTKSAKLHERALKVFSGDGATHIARIINPFRPYITHTKGSRKWDVDGNEYIDYTVGHGALVLGHNHPEVVKAMQEQVAKGVHYGESHELEIEWAELIKSMMPSAERVEFVACGNEAAMMAIRLGRLHTGRMKILKFEQAYHGWCDQINTHGPTGLTAEEYAATTVVIPSNNLDILEKELATKEYAVLMTEAGGSFMAGKYPLEDEFLRALPDLARKYGTVWVLDEVVTGFRDATAGWQGLKGLKPDLTMLGKVIGGGLGVGAVVGRADIMDLFSPKAPPKQRIIHAGTWNANPLTAAAGVATLKLIKTGEPIKKANEAAGWLRQGINNASKERGLPYRLFGRSVLHLHLGPIDFEPSDDTLPPTKDINKLFNPAFSPKWSRMSLHLLNRGVAPSSLEVLILSAAHTKEDINQTVQAFSETLDAMLAEGTLSKS